MAKKRVGKFPKVFRQMAVDRLNHCENIVELAKELGISRRLLYGGFCPTFTDTWLRLIMSQEGCHGTKAEIFSGVQV